VYLWVLLGASVLDNTLRLFLTRRVALLQSERLAEASARKRRTWMGLASIALSPLMLLYGLWHRPIAAWIWVSVLYGVIAGLEYVTSVHFYQSKLIWQTRIFGLFSAAFAATVYFGALRR
jgi:hypothetical protein